MKEKYILKRIAFVILLIAVTGALIFVNRKISVHGNAVRYTEAEEGSFKISVSSTGELLAEKSLDLKGPALSSGYRRGHGRGRRIRSMNIRILDIVSEGTMVKKGDYVAQLDRTNYDNVLKDELDRLKTLQNSLEMKKLDTAMVLTDLRNSIINQKYAVEEASLALEQSRYEPPAIIRQAEIALDKEKRNLKQLNKAYKLRLVQKNKEINNIRLDISAETRLVGDLQNFLAGFTIVSPADGMVIYKRNWNGTKRKAGSEVNPFDMVIATLPDLSSMISKTYISETDISRIKEGQNVNIKIDAFPARKFTGKVVSIAAIGEELPNSDTKVFEVISRLNEHDPALRPSMTTSNEIIIKSFDKAVYVPLECVHTDAGGFSYVFTREKTKQVIVLGESNEKNIIVDEGLDPGTKVYLSTPLNFWKFKLAGEDLLPESENRSEVKVFNNLAE